MVRLREPDCILLIHAPDRLALDGRAISQSAPSHGRRQRHEQRARQ